MKDVMGLLVGSLIVVFVLISLLSGGRSQNSGLVTSHERISDSEPLYWKRYCSSCTEPTGAIAWHLSKHTDKKVRDFDQSMPSPSLS